MPLNLVVRRQRVQVHLFGCRLRSALASSRCWCFALHRAGLRVGCSALARFSRLARVERYRPSTQFARAGCRGPKPSRPRPGLRRRPQPSPHCGASQAALSSFPAAAQSDCRLTIRSSGRRSTACAFPNSAAPAPLNSSVRWGKNMFAIRAMVWSSVVVLLLPCTTHAAVSSTPTAYTDFVHFSASQRDGKFIIECSPSTRAAAVNHSWPTVCNKLGRDAIDRAVKQKLIAPVKGLAFGMASQFPPDYSPDPHISGVTLSRSFPLLGNPI